MILLLSTDELSTRNCFSLFPDWVKYDLIGDAIKDPSGNRLVTTLERLPFEYRVILEFQPLLDAEKATLVSFQTKGKDMDEYGSRTPEIRYYPRATVGNSIKLRVRSAVNGEPAFESM